MTTRVMPPPAAASPVSATVQGRKYTCAVGSTINVPDADALEMAANGWLIMLGVGAAAVFDGSGGPAGPTGPTGPTGATGAAGPNAFVNSGKAVMVVGTPPTVTVASAAVLSTSKIFLTCDALGGITAPVAYTVNNVVPGTSFDIVSGDVTGLDTSTIAWGFN